MILFCSLVLNCKVIDITRNTLTQLSDGQFELSPMWSIPITMVKNGTYILIKAIQVI